MYKERINKHFKGKICMYVYKLKVKIV